MLRLSVLAIVLITGASFLRAAPPGETARFAHKGAIHALALSKDGQQLLTASADKWAYALDAKTLAPVKRFGPHNSEVTGVAGLKDKSVIVSTLEDRQDKHSLMVWDWDNQRVKAVVDDSEMSLFNVAVAPNESILAVSMGNEDGRLYGVPPAGGRLGIDLRNPKWLCKVMRFSPDGRWMAMGSGGGIHCWEIGEKAKPVGDGASDTDGTINGIAWLPNSEQFVTAHVDGILRLWRVKDLTVIGRFPKHAGETQCVAISADGKLLAAGSSDGGLNIYTVATQKLGKQLPHDKAVTAVEFVTSDVVATGTADGIVRLLNLSGDTTVKPMVKPPLATQGSLPKPPAAAEVQAAVALIKEVFSKEYDAAKRPAERAKLAEKLLAQEAKAETIERYALLEESLRLSVEGGSIKSAFAAADRMTAVFQQPPKFHLDYLTKLVDSVGVPKDQGELSTASLRIAQFASDVEQFDDAEQLGRLALKAANKARAAAAQKNVRDFADRLKQTRDRHTAYKEAAVKLEKEPTDAAANLAAGRYFCFSRGEWSTGIPHLALSSDAALKQTAEQELKLTSESPVSAQMAIAEAWQTAAPSASAGDRPYYSASALYWFKKSLPKLSALQKLKAEQEIKKIGTLEVERK